MAVTFRARAHTTGAVRRRGVARPPDLGQHFLASPALASRLVDDAGIGAGDVVVEPGAGRGVLTRALAARAHHVLAIELDTALAHATTRVVAELGNATLVQADATTFPLPQTPFRVVANPAFNTTAALLHHLLDLRACPHGLVARRPGGAVAGGGASAPRRRTISSGSRGRRGGGSAGGGASPPRCSGPRPRWTPQCWWCERAGAAHAGGGARSTTTPPSCEQASPGAATRPWRTGSLASGRATAERRPRRGGGCGARGP